MVEPDSILSAHHPGTEDLVLGEVIVKIGRKGNRPPREATLTIMIARLGGFLCRKSDGEPGVKTIWRGLRRLHDIADTWEFLHTTHPNLVDTWISDNHKLE